MGILTHPVTINAGLMGAMSIGDAKKYIGQQKSGLKTIRTPQAPGGIPEMQKVSAHQALRFYLKKQANLTFTGGMGSLPTALALGAATALGGMVAAGGARGIGSIFHGFQADRMFDELKRRYPEIRQHAKAREYFDLITAYAPGLLKHPAAIGDFLRRQLEYPMSSVEFIKQLAELESTLSHTAGSSPSARFGEHVSEQAARHLGDVAKARDRINSPGKRP